MAKKKEDTKKKGAKEKDPEKEAKRKARMEAIKTVLQVRDRTVNKSMLSRFLITQKFRTSVMQSKQRKVLREYW